MTPSQAGADRRIRATVSTCLRALLIGTLIAPTLVLLVNSTADAAAYRYWSYWSANTDNAWVYSTIGAGSARPKDGDVQGWRFAVSAGASSSTITPRTRGDFAALCGNQQAPPDRKRVGLVVDFGTKADAPRGENPPASRTFCVEAPLNASGAAVLLQALSVRSKNGLVCGINGYPRTECAVVIQNPEPIASSSPRATRSPTEPGTTEKQRDATTPTTKTSSSSKASGDESDTTRATATPSGGSAAKPRSATSDSSDIAVGAPTPTLVTDASATSTSTPTGSPLGVLIAAALLALAAGSAFALKRRSS